MSSRDNRVFNVQRIVNDRVTNGRKEYLVKWQGFPSANNSWEKVEDLHCPQLIEEYEREKRWRLAAQQPSTSAAADALAAEAAPDESAVDQVVGINWETGEPRILILYKDLTSVFMPREEANLRYPQKVIAYYESKLRFEDEPEREEAAADAQEEEKEEEDTSKETTPSSETGSEEAQDEEEEEKEEEQKPTTSRNPRTPSSADSSMVTRSKTRK
uniref:Chromo domain-containing protein n=1 Tax=Caenorhabditis tropicalis TaxID=1561998 RepID=A0A1I7UIB1_9PELO